MTVRTWVGRFSIIDGHVQEEGQWLGSLIRQRPDEEADELYVLIEPQPGERPEYAAQIVDVIAGLYNKDPLSLTGALVRSMRAAHDHLRDWNSRSLKEHRVGAGATCLALRGTDAFLAQAGPSLAYAQSASGEFRRITPERAEFDDALGIADPLEPRLTRIALEPGDLVLLASTQLDDIAPAEHVRSILERGADEALPELYLLCRDVPQFSLVLLSCFEEAEVVSPPDFLTRNGGSIAGPVPESNELTSGAGELVGAGVGVGPQSAEASLALTLDGVPPHARPAHEQVREIKQSTAPPPATGMKLRGGDATPRYKRATGGAIVPQFRVPKLAVFGVIAVVLVGLLVWWQLPGSVQQNREERFSALVAEAHQANAQAQASSDPGQRRDLLNKAQTQLAAAAKIHNDNPDVAALKNDVSDALLSLSSIYEIKDWTPVADLSQQVTGSLSVTRAVVGGDAAYFLDAKGKRVLRLAVDGRAAPDTIFEDGAIEGVLTAARPIQIAWSEQSQSLLIIDEKRQAFAYTPGKAAVPMAVRNVDGFASLDAIAASGGNLYVLDVKDNEVWRYLPGQGGFDSERTALLDGATVKDATEIAVGQDVYMLDSKLGVRRFVGKTEASFPLAGIDAPLMSPASLSVLAGSGRIVVADRGNKRIVVASPDGAFLKQIVSSAFTDLRAAYFDEGTGVLYVLNGDALIKTTFAL